MTKKKDRRRCSSLYFYSGWAALRDLQPSKSINLSLSREAADSAGGEHCFC